MITIFKDEDGMFIAVGWEVARGTLRSLISKAGITIEGFLEALDS
ncbi:MULTISPECIES: hypothetical protein [Nostoc]|nr:MULTISPECIES: hypothetical protein [Nostoc]